MTSRNAAPAGLPLAATGLEAPPATPRVSVVIPTRDRAHLLVEAVQSVLAQTFRDFEVIVCDDGSTDDTAARAAAFGEPVRYLALPPSGRPGVPRNAGVRAARGDWVAFLDDDDLWDPEKLGRQLAAADAAPGAGVVYCDRRVLHEDGRCSGPVLTPEQKRAGDLLPLALEARFPQLSSALVRRDLLEAAGGFDEALTTGEDLDLWLRLPETRAVCVPDPLVVVRRRAHSLSGGSGPLAFANAVRVIERRLAAGDLTPTLRRRGRRTLCRLHLEWGAALRTAGDGSGARRAALRALRLGPTHPPAWLRAARLWTSVRRSAPPSPALY